VDFLKFCDDNLHRVVNKTNIAEILRLRSSRNIMDLSKPKQNCRIKSRGELSSLIEGGHIISYITILNSC